MKHLKMKCVMESSDNGLTWKIERIDYLSEGLTEHHEHKIVNSEASELKGITLKRLNKTL